MRRFMVMVVIAAGSWPVVAWTAPKAAVPVDAGAPGVRQVAGVWLAHGQPIDGLLLQHDESGTLRLQVPLSHGRPDGIEHRWYGDGLRESLRLYRDGRKVGRHTGWWPDGAPRFDATYADDAFDGEVRTWHANGRLFEVRHYVGGREEGLQQSWSPDGDLYLNYEVRNGRRFGYINAKPCTPVSGAM